MPRGKVFGPSTHYVAGPPASDDTLSINPNPIELSGQNLRSMTTGGIKASATILGEMEAIKHKDIKNKKQTRVKKDQVSKSQMLRWTYGEGGGDRAAIGSKLKTNTNRMTKALYN